MDKIFLWVVLLNLLGILLYLGFVKVRGLRKILRPLLYVVTIAGGGFGVLLYIGLFDRKTQKDDLMFRVFLISMVIIQAILFMLIWKIGPGDISFDLFSFIRTRPWILGYFLIINLCTFLAFGLDKRLARKSKRRISNLFLLSLCFIGGTIGGLGGMRVFRHKTLKNYYKIGLPLMLAAQVVFLIFLINLSK